MKRREFLKGAGILGLSLSVAIGTEHQQQARTTQNQMAFSKLSRVFFFEDDPDSVFISMLKARQRAKELAADGQKVACEIGWLAEPSRCSFGRVFTGYISVSSLIMDITISPPEI